MPEKPEQNPETREARRQEEADRKRGRVERPYDFPRSWGLAPGQADHTYWASHFMKGVGWVSDEGPDGGPPGPIPQEVADRIGEILRDAYLAEPSFRAAVDARATELRAETKSTTNAEESNGNGV
jgi:hypothetical protein